MDVPHTIGIFSSYFQWHRIMKATVIFKNFMIQVVQHLRQQQIQHALLFNLYHQHTLANQSQYLLYIFCPEQRLQSRSTLNKGKWVKRRNNLRNKEIRYLKHKALRWCMQRISRWEVIGCFLFRSIVIWNQWWLSKHSGFNEQCSHNSIIVKHGNTSINGQSSGCLPQLWSEDTAAGEFSHAINVFSTFCVQYRIGVAGAARE